jgi:hypothetical protein
VISLNVWQLANLKMSSSSNIIWIRFLLVSLVSTLGIYLGMIPNPWDFGEPLDIQLHDTYFVLSKREIVILLWFGLSGLVTLIFLLIKGFKHKLANKYMLLSNVLFVTVLLSFYNEMLGYFKEISHDIHSMQFFRFVQVVLALVLINGLVSLYFVIKQSTRPNSIS